MCSTCGCADGERHIEGDEHHHAHDDHHHDHPHAHPHNGDPVFAHRHAGAARAPRTIRLPGGGEPAQVVNHYHGDVHVHNHYYYGPVTQAAPGPRRDAEQGDGPSSGGPEAFAPSADARGDLHYGHGEAGTHAPGLTQRRMVEIEIDVLDKNNRLAAHNRQHFLEQNILALNLVSSPGSGKTTLLTETLLRLKDQISCAVIEGDQQTTNDAERIRATGAPAIQVNTGKGCHLDAQMIHDAAHRLALPDNSLLFIENVGNLVCPAGFDLGERHKVVVLSVTEGEDKPLKYPHMFAAAGLMILNKTDLLPWVHFNVDACIANARQVNPAIAVLLVSAATGEGMDAWISWLAEQRGC